MTSKISFFKLMQEDIRRKLWLLVLSILVFFISFPVVLMLILDNIGRYSYLTPEQIQENAKGMFLVLMGYDNIWMVLITIVGAALCGIFAFSYLYKKKKVDFYHSIPVRREKLFLVSYFDGILFYLIPYLTVILLCVLIGSRYFTIDSKVWSVILKEFGVQMLYYLMLYHTTILASILAGNMFGCLFLNGIAELYTLLLYGVYLGYCNSYFDTYVSFSYGQGIGETIAKFSPIVSFVNTISYLTGGNSLYLFRLAEGESSIKLYLMQCFLVSVLLLGISIYLYKVRASEMAGKAIAFKKIQPIVRILLVLPAAMAGGWIFENMTDYHKTGWMLFGVLFTAVLVHGVIEVLYQSDIRKILDHKIQLAGTIIAAAAAALILRNDWIGYDAYVPKLDRIESAAISIDGIEDSGFYEFESPYGERRTISSFAYKMEKMNLSGEMLPIIHQLMSLGAETDKRNDSLEHWVEFYVKVRLKGGREVLRSYRVSLDQAYDLLNTVFQSPEYKKSTYAYFFENSSRIEELEIRGLSREWQFIPKEDSVEFLKIYQKELLEVSLDDLRDYPVIGKMMCYVEEGRDYNELYLLPTMEESIAYLKRIGIFESNVYWVHPLAENVLSIQVTGNYQDKEWGETEEGIIREKSIEITEEEMIEKLCQKLYFSTGWSTPLFWGRMYENNYIISVVLKPEASQRYFNEEEKILGVQVRDFDEEIFSLLDELIQEYDEMK